MENWDDLRLFLATARAGSSRGAAALLDVNQSTVSRRIAQLEERAEARFFDRRPQGFVLTAAGQELLELAESIERSIETAQREIAGRDIRMEGSVRLSLPDFLVPSVSQHLPAFVEANPRIGVELVVDNGLLDLSQRQADLVFRLAQSPDAELVGHRVSPVAMAVYGCATADSSAARPVDFSALPWVRWDHAWRETPPERWIDERVAATQVRARVNNSATHSALIAAGLGVGLAPCFFCDNDPRLVRLASPMQFGLSVWLLTHADLRKTGRVRALMRFLRAKLSAEPARFAGSAV